MKNPKQSGNMLFILLIAIALLGGLTALLVRSGGTSDDTGTAEQASINASQIMNYASGLEMAISMLTSQGCSEGQINFDHASLTGYDNLSAPPSKSCNVFDVAGAGQNVKFFSHPLAVSGSYRAVGMGTTATDLVYQYTIDKETCMLINDKLGVVNDGVNGPRYDRVDGGSKFIGTYATTVAAGTNEINQSAFVGKKAGCHDNTGSASPAYVYHHVLLKR